MSNFLRDLWHDLREKRLWPVAALLAIALVAVPVLLKKSGDSGSGPASRSAPAASSDKPIVVADTGAGKVSNLGVFDAKNPFKPDHLPKLPGTGASSSTPTAGSGSSGRPSGSGSTNATPVAPPSSGGGTGGGSTGGDGTSGGGTGGGSEPSRPQQPKSGSYAYTVDVKFGKRGSVRTRHGLQKLDLLPNANNPLLVFLGVNATGDTAVFLTDTSLKAAGEGRCKPNGDVCSFLYLKLHDTEELSEQARDGTGTEYTLKLTAIHKVPASKLARKARSKAAKKARARRARRLRNKPGTPFHLLFTLPRLPDLVG